MAICMLQFTVLYALTFYTFCKKDCALNDCIHLNTYNIVIFCHFHHFRYFCPVKELCTNFLMMKTRLNISFNDLHAKETNTKIKNTLKQDNYRSQYFIIIKSTNIFTMTNLHKTPGNFFIHQIQVISISFSLNIYNVTPESIYENLSPNMSRVPHSPTGLLVTSLH